MVLTTKLVNPREHPSYPFPAPHTGDQVNKRKGKETKGKARKQNGGQGNKREDKGRKREDRKVMERGR